MTAAASATSTPPAGTATRSPRNSAAPAPRVSKIAKELGLSFNREATAAATEAKVIDAKARRAQLMHDLLDDAERLRQQLFALATLHSFGGKDHTYPPLAPGGTTTPAP